MEFMQHNAVYARRFTLDKVKTDFQSVGPHIDQIGMLIFWTINQTKQLFIHISIHTSVLTFPENPNFHTPFKSFFCNNPHLSTT